MLKGFLGTGRCEGLRSRFHQQSLFNSQPSWVQTESLMLIRQWALRDTVSRLALTSIEVEGNPAVIRHVTNSMAQKIDVSIIASFQLLMLTSAVKTSSLAYMTSHSAMLDDREWHNVPFLSARCFFHLPPRLPSMLGYKIINACASKTGSYTRNVDVWPVVVPSNSWPTGICRYCV